MFEDEKWLPIKEFPHYHISTCGRVKHVDGFHARKLTVNNRGFPIVTLYGEDSKTRYLRQVNTLVAEAFLNDFPVLINGLETDRSDVAVWHLDGDLTNCRVENLKWELRARVLEWNEMHRRGEPKYKTPRVRNNLTGEIYENAYECALAEGLWESQIVWRIESQANHLQDLNAAYMYVLKGDPYYV